MDKSPWLCGEVPRWRLGLTQFSSRVSEQAARSPAQERNGPNWIGPRSSAEKRKRPGPTGPRDDWDTVTETKARFAENSTREGRDPAIKEQGQV